MTSTEIEELLELLSKNNIHSYVEPSNRGPVLKVLFKYPLNQVTDYKGLLQRLINFNDLDLLGL